MKNPDDCRIVVVVVVDIANGNRCCEAALRKQTRKPENPKTPFLFFIIDLRRQKNSVGWSADTYWYRNPAWRETGIRTRLSACSFVRYNSLTPPAAVARPQIVLLYRSEALLTPQRVARTDSVTELWNATSTFQNIMRTQKKTTIKFLHLQTTRNH